MIIFIAGMPRSGSTFCFNIARDILRARGSVTQHAAANLADIRAGDHGADHVLLKSHEADAACLDAVAAGAARAVCSLRRPEDAIASWMDIFGQSLEESIAVMRRWIVMFRAIEPHALILSYGMIERWPLLAAWRVARFVTADAGWREITAAAWRVDKRSVSERLARLDPTAPGVTRIAFSHYESDTFLHRRHVAPEGPRRAAALLRREHIEAIRSALAGDIDARGELRRLLR